VLNRDLAYLEILFCLLNEPNRAKCRIIPPPNSRKPAGGSGDLRAVTGRPIGAGEGWLAAFELGAYLAAAY
jgi:hypothetical protein